MSNSNATQTALLPTPSDVNYNGFDSKSFSPTGTGSLRPSIRRSLGLPESGLVVGLVGVIARWKGQREFLQMVKKISEHFPETYFWVVGSEIYDTTGEEGELNHLKRWVEINNLQSKIIFSPFQNPVQPVYSSLDILVHASITPEPFGRVLVEALMSGVPVVAADQGGPLEIVKEGINGLLYTMGNVDAMAEKVQVLLSDPEKRKAMGLEAPKVAEKFSSQKVHKELETILLDH